MPPGRRPEKLWTHVPVATSGRNTRIVLRASRCPAPGFLVDGLGTTTVARTLVDLAGSQNERVVGWAWKQAEFLGQLDLAALQQELSKRRPGVVAIRKRLSLHHAITGPPEHFIGQDEVWFLKLVLAAGLPRPEVNARVVIGTRVCIFDFYWREYGLVVELDDPGHMTATARDSDVLRDAECFAAGLDVLRFLVPRAEAEPEHCMALIRAGLDRKRAATRV